MSAGEPALEGSRPFGVPSWKQRASTSCCVSIAPYFEQTPPTPRGAVHDVVTGLGRPRGRPLIAPRARNEATRKAVSSDGITCGCWTTLQVIRASGMESWESEGTASDVGRWPWIRARGPAGAHVGNAGAGRAGVPAPQRRTTATGSAMMHLRDTCDIRLKWRRHAIGQCPPNGRPAKGAQPLATGAGETEGPGFQKEILASTVWSDCVSYE